MLFFSLAIMAGHKQVYNQFQGKVHLAIHPLLAIHKDGRVSISLQAFWYICIIDIQVTLSLYIACGVHSHAVSSNHYY